MGQGEDIGNKVDFFTGNPDKIVVEDGEMPKFIPKVPEIGATSGPLKSASYFIGSRCEPYNVDFIQCRGEAIKSLDNPSLLCLKEGRRVTRCAISVLEDVRKSCGKEFKNHYNCLARHNLKLNECRPAEDLLNSCVYKNLSIKKKIPDGLEKPIFEKKNPIFRPSIQDPQSYTTVLKSREE